MSEWIDFVKEFSRMNNIPYSAALKEARPYYDNYRKQKFIKNMPHYPRGNGVMTGEHGGISRCHGGYEKMAGDLLGYGGAEAQKGALAALLSGLDAQIKIN